MTSSDSRKMSVLRKIRRRKRRKDRKLVPCRPNHLVLLHRTEIFTRYRFRPETIEFLINEIGQKLQHVTHRSYALSPSQQILVALRYYASGANLQLVGDSVSISKATTSRTVEKVTDALCGVQHEFIKFPETDSDVGRCKSGFHRIAGFPNVVGCVDGTYVRIVAPHENETDYVNRKGFHSLNIQMVCDHSYRITNCVSKWPGSVHDSRIFRESRLSEKFENGSINGLLLGDSGYSLRPYLMTPYLHPRDEHQEKFNDALCKTRVVIEQTFGILKKRFPCLQIGMRMKPEKACAVIVACAVLHNLGIDIGDIIDKDDITYFDDDGNSTTPTSNTRDGKATRDYIANTFFFIKITSHLFR